MNRFIIVLILFFVSLSAKGQDYVDFSVGYEYYTKGNFEEAIKYFDKSINKNPDHGDSYYFKALLLARVGKLSEALPVFNKAIQINPKDGAYYGDRGILFAQSGEEENALNDFEIAAKYDSLNPARHFNLAAYYLNKGNCEKAIYYLDNCLEVKPSHLVARFKRAVCLIKNTQRNAAVSDLSYIIDNFQDQSTVLNPRDYTDLLGTVYFMRGGIYGENEEFKKAISDLKKAITYKTNDAALYNNLGYYLIFTDELDSSLAYLNKSIQMKPNPNNLNSRAYAYYKLGKLNLAKIDALKAKELDETHAESYYNLSLVYNSNGKYEQACDFKKTAIAMGLEKAKQVNILNCN